MSLPSVKTGFEPGAPLYLFFLGGLPIVGGTLTILVSLDLLEYVDLTPNRIAIFNDPHTWQVFATGTMMLTFGLAAVIPQRMKMLGRINRALLAASVAAVVVGVILRKMF